jgi:hypothetical protein
MILEGEPLENETQQRNGQSHQARAFHHSQLVTNLARTFEVQSSEDEEINKIKCNDVIVLITRYSYPASKFIKQPQATF